MLFNKRVHLKLKLKLRLKSKMPRMRKKEIVTVSAGKDDFNDREEEDDEVIEIV